MMMETRSKKRAREDRRGSVQLETGEAENESGTGTSFVFGDVLESMLAFQSTRELKVSRQVSKEWNTEACRALRKRSFLHFNEVNIRSLPSIVSVMEMGRALELPTPFEDISGQLISSKSYTILRDLTTKDLLPLLRITSLQPMVVRQRRLPLVHRALIKWAPHLKNLDFFADFYAAQFPNIPLMEHLRFPQLKSLGFMIDESSNQDSVDFIVSVINGSPQLVDLNFKYLHFHMGLTSFREIYTRANLQNIQELTVLNFYYFSFPHILEDLLLIQNDCSLRTLGLGNIFDVGLETSWRLLRVFTKFAKSLQRLSWTFNVAPEAVASSFPCLGQLISLELKDFSFGNQFWSRVPALKKFKCKTMFFVEEDFDAEQRVKHSNLEEFNFQRYGNVDVVVGAQILYDTFPGLMTLGS